MEAMRSPLCALLLLTGCHANPSGDGSDSGGPPNILFLLADDQRTDTIGAWGNPAIETPRLDALVERGFSFRGASCLGSSGGAVCVPSRAMIHTGRAYIGMNLSSFDGRPTLGGLLGEAGYRTFATGKWHNGRESFQRSFARGRNVLFGGMSNHHAVPLIDFDGEEFGEKRTGEGHSSTLFADAAIQFLREEARGDAPFFLYVAFTAPHDPRDPPAEERDRYKAERPPLPPNFLPQHPFDNGFCVLRDENLAPWPRTEYVVREQLAEYWALVSHLDREVGRILDALEESGEAGNTLVVYAADHGLAVGSHGLLGKQSLYEHSMGAPMILAGPGIPQGSSDALVYLHDLFPTLLARAGVRGPASETAYDLAPLWSGVAPELRSARFHAMGRTQRAIRDRRWKLIRYPRIDRTQLFDLETDPHECQDLSEDPAHAHRIATLRAELEAWQARLGDDVPWVEAEPRSGELELTGKSRQPDRWQPAWIRAKYFETE